MNFPAVMRVVHRGSFACPLCKSTMATVDGNRLACRTEGCAQAGVKYEYPVDDLYRSGDQREPPTLESVLKHTENRHLEASYEKAVAMHETIRPERKGKR